MNQRTKMWGDIEKIFTGNANLDTARSLTSIIAEQAIYNTIRYYASKYILIWVFSQIFIVLWIDFYNKYYVKMIYSLTYKAYTILLNRHVGTSIVRLSY